MATPHRTRPGMHYQRRTEGQSPQRHAFTARDRAYRLALGVGEASPLPRSIGSGRI